MTKDCLLIVVLAIIGSCFVFGSQDVESNNIGTEMAKQLPLICVSNCSQSMNFTPTKRYCDSDSDLTLQGRCCINTSTADVRGIDLQNCSLTRKMFVSGIKSLSNVAIMSLQGNLFTSLPDSDFDNNTNLEYLSLPPEMRCPGGNESWENETLKESYTLCLHELPSCHVHNVSCPDNSHCEQAGTNKTVCLCDEDYHGYKCMKKGHFPFLNYGIGITIPTVALCIWLWFTQRRHVKPKPKRT